MPIEKKIDYLELPAKNLDAVKTFYSQVFDWSFTDYGPDYIAFTDRKLEGGFYMADLQSRTANAAALIIFYTEDLVDTRDEVVSAGGTILKEIFSFPGGRRFHFADPNGNELAVWTDRLE